METMHDFIVHTRQRRAAAEFDAQVRDIRRRAIADRRARFVIMLANSTSDIGTAATAVTSDILWWHEGLTSVDRARLILAAGGPAW